MGTVLRGGETAEVIPFDYDAPVLYYPVRHHSPACAWHLELAMERYRPELVLVEGPESANDLIPILADPKTCAPVALYYAYRDDAGLLRAGEPEAEDEAPPPEHHACYYPFLDQSPELAALRLAGRMGIPARFMDLPYGEILAATRAGSGLRAEEPGVSYASDRYLSPALLWQRVCESTGVRDFEEFWETYYECRGLAMPTGEFVRQVNAWCLLARENTPRREMEEDGCLAREAHMARRIREAGKSCGKILVVAGGFHLWGLAALRGKPAPGLYELQDGVLSAFVKGEANLAGCEPLRLLREIDTGARVGSLCRDDLVPPLVQDFAGQCKKYRLRQDSAERQEVTLEIFSRARHRAESRFLHQTDFLECGFARWDKGPDLLRGTGRSLIREHWVCQWSAEVETALVEHAVWGSTVAEACDQLLRRRLAEATRAQEGASLLVQGFLMGLGDTADAMARRVEELLLTDGDFSSLCRACAAVSTLDTWQEQYGERGGYDYPALLRQCFARILQMLPSMSAVDDRRVEAVQENCQLLYEITARPAFADLRAVLLRALEELIAQDPIHPALHGAALGLLYGGAPEKKDLAVQTAAGYLQGTHDQKLRSAAFLQGLFRTARDLLLVDEVQLASIDGLLCELEDEEFITLLPQLRLAFSYFTPAEADRLGRQAAALHGAARLKTAGAPVSPAAYSEWEAIDAWAAEHLSAWGPEPDEEGGEEA